MLLPVMGNEDMLALNRLLVLWRWIWFTVYFKHIEDVHVNFAHKNIIFDKIIAILTDISDISLATYFRLSFRFFKKGSCQLLAK